MQEQIVQLVLQAGGVGVGIYALYILHKLVGNHLKHNTEVLYKLVQAIERLEEFLRNHIKK